MNKEQHVEKGDKRRKRIQRLADIQQSGDTRIEGDVQVNEDTGTQSKNDSERHCPIHMTMTMS